MKIFRSIKTRHVLVVLAIILTTWAITRTVWVSGHDLGVMWRESAQSEDTASFWGAWRIVDEPKGYASQTTLSCRKTANECVVADAPLSYFGGWSSSLYIQYYEITEWEDGIIKAELDDACALTVITANISEATARAVSTWKTENVEECGEFEEATTEWVLESKEPAFFGELAESISGLFW